MPVAFWRCALSPWKRWHPGAAAAIAGALPVHPTGDAGRYGQGHLAKVVISSDFIGFQWISSIKIRILKLYKLLPSKSVAGCCMLAGPCARSLLWSDHLDHWLAEVCGACHERTQRRLFKAHQCFLFMFGKFGNRTTNSILLDSFGIFWAICLEWRHCM